MRYGSQQPVSRLSTCVLLLLGMAPVAFPAQQDAPAPPTASAAATQPKFSSPEEAAAWEKIQQERNPDEQIRLVEDFLLHYPDSAMKESAFQAAAHSYQAKGDYGRAITYGELTLSENPDNLTTLLVLAAAISEMTSRNDDDRDERLAEGEQYARHALDLLATARRPPAFAATEWDQTKREAEAAAHAALGLIALIREDFARAELELQEAVALAARPDAVLLYRLGLTHSFMKKYDLALETLERAAALGGVKLPGAQGASRDLVAEAKEFVLRTRSAPASPEPADPEAAVLPNSAQATPAPTPPPADTAPGANPAP